jgi:hypothetical protein
MRLRDQIAAICLLIATTGAYTAVVRAQDFPRAEIEFSEPSQFQCGTNIPWTSLSGWQGEPPGKCRNEYLFTVVGKSMSVKEGYIKSRIVVPEDNNREWPAYNGEDHEINNGNFRVQLCISSRTVTRPIWFQVYSKDGKKVGSKCTVTVVSPKLEN